MGTSTEWSTDADSPIDVVTVVLDPRVAYVGFGPDDGRLAQLARRYDAKDVLEDLADTAEKLDFAYLRAWMNAAARMAPDVAWNVSARYHQSTDDFPLLEKVAKIGREDRDWAALIDQISAVVTVETETLSFGATRWAVIDGGRMVGSATLEHTVMSVEDQYIAGIAAGLRDGGEVLRSVDSGDVRLELIEPGGRIRHEPGTLGYVLTDRGTVIFAGADFRPSPLHAVDSDRAVEALAEFLALRPGDTDGEYFTNYTERQSLWAAGESPSKLYELITALPSDPEYIAQTAADAEMDAEHAGEIRAWYVRPLDRTDLPQLGVEPSNAPLRRGQPVIPGVRGQQTLDWAVEHVNYWGTEAVVVTDLVPAGVTLRVPATGTATVAIVNASAIAHAGAHVEAHRRSRITALPDSDVRIYPGAAVNRRPGSYVTLAPESRMLQRGGAFQQIATQQHRRTR